MTNTSRPSGQAFFSNCSGVCEPAMQLTRNLLKWAVTMIAVSLGALVVAATLVYLFIHDVRHKGYCA